MDIAKGEVTEKELDAMIERHHDRRVAGEGHRPSEEMCARSVVAYNAKAAQNLALQWLKHHERMLCSHQTTSALICAHHEAEIAKYAAMLGNDYGDGDA
jgi:hypothetical protein